MYRRKYQGWVKHLDFIILDVLCLQAAFAAAYMLRHGLRSPYEDLIYRNISLILILIDVLVLLGANSFKNVLKRGYLRELKHSVRHAVLVVVTASFYLFATQTGGSYSRLTFFYMGGLYALFTFIVRIIWKNRMRSAIRSREREKSMLVVTTRERAESLLFPSPGLSASTGTAGARSLAGCRWQPARRLRRSLCAGSGWMRS